MAVEGNFSMAQSSRGTKKHDAFQRLAVQRTNAVLQRLRILGNCANRQLYEFDDVEVKKIFRAVENEVRATKARFLNSNDRDFSL